MGSRNLSKTVEKSSSSPHTAGVISPNSIFDYWYSCVSRNYSVRLHKNEFIYFGRLFFRQRFFCRLHSHFPLSPRYMRCCTRMFSAMFIQIIAERLRSYSSYSPIPPMTQHSTSLLIFETQSTSLLIFWTFILTHSFAICYFRPSFWHTQLPFCLCCSSINFPVLYEFVYIGPLSIRQAR